MAGETLVIDPTTERLTSRTVGGVTTDYTYDRAGNLVTRTRHDTTWTYGYDPLDRLVSVRHNGNLIARYRYDVLGRRIVKRVYSTASGGTVGYTRFVYQGSHVSFEADSAGTIGLRYTWGAGTDDLVAITTAAGLHYYVTTDRLGSVRSIAKRDGTWQLSQRFDPYGRLVARDSASGATIGAVLRYGWTGREWDAETGFSFHRARYFDPQSRRWTQEDPIGYAGGANLYAYVGGSPMEATDPSGMNKALDPKMFWRINRPAEHYNIFLPVHTGWEPIEMGFAALPPRPDLSYVDGLISAETSGVNCCYESLDYKTDDALHARYRGAEDDPLVGLAAIGLGIVAGGPAGWRLAARLVTVLGPRAGPALPVISAAGAKINDLSAKFSVSSAELVSRAVTGGQHLRDLANAGNVNMLIARPDAASGYIRITTDPEMTRVISAGLMRAEQVANGIARGRFVPLN